MNIFEELTKQENKKKWQQLVKKYHPDNKETGDEKIMKKVNNAYEKGDRIFERLVAELKGEKPPTDDYDKVDDESTFDRDDFDPRMHDSPIYTLVRKIKKKNDFVTGFFRQAFRNREIVEVITIELKNGYEIKITVKLMQGRSGMVDVDIKLMDGTKSVEDEGPVPIANDEMLEKRINELIEKAKNLKQKGISKK